MGGGDAAGVAGREMVRLNRLPNLLHYSCPTVPAPFCLCVCVRMIVCIYFLWGVRGGGGVPTEGDGYLMTYV